jgi:hypothetical protein
MQSSSQTKKSLKKNISLCSSPYELLATASAKISTERAVIRLSKRWEKYQTGKRFCAEGWSELICLATKATEWFKFLDPFMNGIISPLDSLDLPRVKQFWG